MKRKKIVIAVLILSMFTINLSTMSFANNTEENTISVRSKELTPDTWYSGFAEIPTPRTNFDMVTVGTKIYVLGGKYDSKNLDVVEVYDTINDTWKTLSPMPKTSLRVTAEYLDGKIYAIVSDNKDWDVLVYNIKTDTWETKSSLNTDKSPRNGKIASTIKDDVIYIIGSYLELMSYNPKTDIWDIVNTDNFVGSLNSFELEYVNGKIHFVADCLEGMMTYDFETNSWRTTNRFDTPHPFDVFYPPHNTVTINNTVYSQTYYRPYMEIIDCKNEISKYSSTNSNYTSGVNDKYKYNYKISAVGNKIYSMGGPNGNEVHMYVTDEVVEPGEDIDMETNPLDLAEEAVTNAESTKDPADIESARDLVNQLPESEEKNNLQDRINAISPDLYLDLLSSSANLDIYIECENMLSMSLDTNSVNFEDYSGAEPMEKLGAVNITISSSLPYSLNAYIPSEIQNSDGSNKIELAILNIKESSEGEYKQFTNTTEKLILKDDCEKGNNINHAIDLKLDSSDAHKADVYKTVIKFEVEQK